RLGVLLGHLRAVVTTWKQDIEGIEYSHSTTNIEEPQRAITQLRNLARGHALSQGRTYITIQDLPLVIKVVLSTASLDRVNEFDWFLSDEFNELRQGFEPTDNSEFIKDYCKKYKIYLGRDLPPRSAVKQSIENYIYNCYECIKVNHGKPVFQTNSLAEYQKHWIKSGHKGPCIPSLVDIEYHGWTPQRKPWEV